jgi:hypothetical protein
MGYEPAHPDPNTTLHCEVTTSSVATEAAKPISQLVSFNRDQLTGAHDFVHVMSVLNGRRSGSEGGCSDVSDVGQRKSRGWCLPKQEPKSTVQKVLGPGVLDFPLFESSTESSTEYRLEALLAPLLGVKGSVLVGER